MAEGIERLGEADRQPRFAICRYLCVIAGLLHAMAPYAHFQYFGCLEESEIRCDVGTSTDNMFEAFSTHTVLQQDGEQLCVILNTLSCSPTSLDRWMHVLSAFASCGVFYSTYLFSFKVLAACAICETGTTIGFPVTMAHALCPLGRHYNQDGKVKKPLYLINTY